jgi:hypothetical protein
MKYLIWKMKKNIKSQAPYKPENNMPRQAVPALIGKYEIMFSQGPGCLINLNNPQPQSLIIKKNLDIRKCG